MNERNEEYMQNEFAENVQMNEEAQQEQAEELYVEFSKPFLFEEEHYRGIDMSGLCELTTKDLCEIEKKFYRLGITSFNPENTASYAKVVAQKASGMPVEFFDQLPIKEMMEIKKTVVNFLFV